MKKNLRFVGMILAFLLSSTACFSLLISDGNYEDKEQEWVGLFGADYMRELEAVITYRESRIFLKQ